jgi:hypothetical protein
MVVRARSVVADHAASIGLVVKQGGRMALKAVRSGQHFAIFFEKDSPAVS